MIEARDLVFSYASETFRLEVPKFTVDSGARLAMIGPSGSGKTTLLTLIAGIARPDRGTLIVEGQNIASMADRARRAFRARHIGFVFQNFSLIDYLSARENILYPYRVGLGLRLDKSVRDRADALAERCRIADKLERLPAGLSQGERQRVAICRALVTQPKLILADEPTGSLDPTSKGVILDVLFECAAEIGATVVTVTHDHELLPSFDRVIDFADLRHAP